MLSLADRERIRRGAAFLDEKVPGWADRIKLGEFDISDTYNCILGQLYGEYSKGVKELGLSKYDVAAFGFFPEFIDSIDTVLEKNAFWEAEIQERVPVSVSV